MTNIYITNAPSGWYATFKGGDFRLCVETLKSFLPPHSRAYNPTTRAWFIDETAEASFHKWLAYARTNLGCRVEWVATDETNSDAHERARKPHTSAKVDAYTTLFLLPDAPVEVVRAAYRALAMKHHPDLGGDVRAMQTIIAAYEQLAA